MDDLLRAGLARLERWVHLHPVAGSRALAQVADEIASVLAQCGLTVERHAHSSGDLLVAHGAGAGPLLGVYGHYDVEAGGSTAMEVAEGRLWGRGVGDNLGPLALRLSVLESHSYVPNLLWVIEPGEEIGSPALAEWLEKARIAEPNLWLDETGYFDADGTQRVLAIQPDEHTHEVTRRCAELAATMGRSTRVEERRLHRVVPETGFPIEGLFQGVPYLALGPNDDRSDVHGEHESLPLNTLELSMRQFEVLLDAFSVGAESMKVIAFHVQHDAGVSVADSGQLRLALELERLFEERHFECASSEGTFRAQWRRALDVVRAETGIERFDVAVTSWVPPSKRRILRELVDAPEWRTVDHHVAHGLHGLHDAPFEKPLVVSFDGGGNDGTFRVFRGLRREGKVRPLARLQLNMGTPYRLLATTMPEVTGRRPQPRAGHLSLAGKLMAYAALSPPRHDWLGAVVDYYRTYQEPSQALFSLGEALGLELEPDALDEEDARSLAATSQAAFEAILIESIGEYREGADVDGIVLTGGCALNVVANQKVRRTFDVPVHVPPAPNDAGISVGALWSVEPPVGALSPFVGPELLNDVGEAVLRQRGGRKATVEELVSLVQKGAIIGMAQGRAELGPRALGNRSIVAAADRPELRERINARIKSREWYRPVAPAVLASAAPRLFEGAPRSPYMSFAVPVRESARALLAGAVHVDGTARLQTVDDPTSALGSLLFALERAGATPCVLNTSFNVRARPLLQRASAALDALDTTELDFAWIDGWLVPRDAAVNHRFEERP